MSPASFGKRRPPLRLGTQAAPPPANASVVLPPGHEALGRRQGIEDDAGPRMVPNSVGAGILAGAVIGVVHLGLVLRTGIDPVLHLGPTTLALGEATTPLVLAGSLWSGGRGGFNAAFIVHAILRRLGRTTFADYAILGAAVGVATALLLQALGLGSPDQGWLVEGILGAMAGAAYRLFAGARSA